MKSSTFGALAAGAVLGLLGAGIASATEHEGEEKACYRTACGKSVKGHEGKCGGTKVDAITDEAACKAAGGAWTTAADAKQYEKNEEG
jgi:hypothetical protein